MPGYIRFGVYEFDRDTPELRKHGMPIRLQEQPLQILAALLEKPGEVVTRQELQDRIWGNGTFVDFEQSLNRAMNRLRVALNDDPAEPRYIETFRTRGYRFIAPVTGAIGVEQSPSRESSELQGGKPDSARRLGKALALSATGILVAFAIAGIVVWSKKPGSSRLPEPRHVASRGFYPTLSRDGTLLSYVSAIGGDVPHIWVRQTAGGDAIPLTKGPDPDFFGDISPDNTRVAFYSGRDGGGVYIAPTLPGEPRLVARTGGSSGAVHPRFSGEGKTILYVQDQKAFTVSAEGARPTSLGFNRDFEVDNALWGPNGSEVLFHGVSRRAPDKTAHWWIATLSMDRPSLVALPGIALDDFEAVRGWIRMRNGREWIVYSVASRDAWKLFRIGVSARGQVERDAQQLASGLGELEHASASEDGQLVYSIVARSGHIYQIPIDNKGQKIGPALQLVLTDEGDDIAPSVSRDGRWMAYNATRPGRPGATFLRDLKTSAERFLEDKGHRPGDVATSISPDGSKVILQRNCELPGVWLQGILPDCSFLIGGEGGEPEKICDFCVPRGFSSDGSMLLIQKEGLIAGKGRDKIVALDLATRTEKEFLSLPDNDLYHAYFSWDDRWVVFKKLLASTMLSWTKAQILIAPVRNGVAGGESEWIAVTDGRYGDDKPQFSADGNTVFFTSTRDGYLCIWAQKLDPLTKRPMGAPIGYEHFHNSTGWDARLVSSDLSVGRDKILINMPQERSDVWVTQLQ